jgi:hypothetical protein
MVYPATVLNSSPPPSFTIFYERAQVIRRSIHKIAATDFVRSAIAEQADLSAFKEKPSLRIIAGVFAIAFSYVIGWPAIAGLGILAAKCRQPLIVVIGGPVAYGLSHLVFLLGMYLAGAVYSLIFLRWITRITMEKLLAWVK